jgi:hypothetical protein
MDYVTAQLLLLLTKINEALEKTHYAIDNIQKNEEHQHRLQDRRLKQILYLYQESERNQAINTNRANEVQKGIRKATYLNATFTLLAVIAATVYACFTHGQWQTAKQALEAQTRPWIDIDSHFPDPKSLDGFYVTLTNYGNSPALMVGQQLTFTLGY